MKRITSEEKKAWLHANNVAKGHKFGKNTLKKYGKAHFVAANRKSYVVQLQRYGKGFVTRRLVPLNEGIKEKLLSRYGKNYYQKINQGISPSKNPDLFIPEREDPFCQKCSQKTNEVFSVCLSCFNKVIQ